MFRDESNLVLEKQSIDTPNGIRDALRVVSQKFSTIEGVKCASDHRTLWEVFLTPFNSTSARIARGEKVLSVFEEIRYITGKDPYNLYFADPPRIRPKNEEADKGKTAEKNRKDGNGKSVPMKRSKTRVGAL